MPAEPESPPLMAVPAPPGAATRVAVGLVLFGAVDAVQGIVSLFAAFRGLALSGGSINVAAPFSCLAFWLAAWLVWTDKRIIWPILAYLSALGLGGIVGAGIAGTIGLPGKLLQAIAASHPGWTGFYLAYLALLTALFAWLLIEAGRIEWKPVFPGPRRGWLKPRAFAAYSATFCALLTAGMLALLTGSWTGPVLARARQKLGPEYDYQLMSYHFRTVNGHTTHHAVVLAYSETELNQIALNWED